MFVFKINYMLRNIIMEGEVIAENDTDLKEIVCKYHGNHEVLDLEIEKIAPLLKEGQVVSYRRKK